MPIRPENRGLYPSNWAEISAWVRFVRAGSRCECTGECGRASEHLEAGDGRCRNRHGEPRWRGTGWQCAVILTTAHLNHTPQDCDPENLRAMCEGCHLAYDREHHAATREQHRIERLGMDPLFDLAAP